MADLGRSAKATVVFRSAPTGPGPGAAQSGDLETWKPGVLAAASEPQRASFSGFLLADIGSSVVEDHQGNGALGWL
jgi:hypothetical protein